MPILQLLPNPLTTRGKQLHKDLVDTYGGFIDEIRQRLEAGLAVPDCLAESLVLAQEAENLDHLDMAILASAFMIGGVETVRWLVQFASD